MAVGDAIWEAEGREKRAAVQAMFGRIAPSYDLLNSLISFRLHGRWRGYAASLLNLKPGDTALDVCCGTGDFVGPLRRLVGAQGSVVGLDFCAPMLAVARQKGVRADSLVLADACCLPVADGSVDGVTVGWGIRNVPDLDLAHREIARVLRPGGRFVSIDMASPRNGLVRRVSTWMFNTMVPRLGSLFGQREAYTYLPKSTQRFSTREELIDSMQRAGLVKCGWKDLMLGNVCVHWGERA